MANKLYEESSVQAIADAIRAKNGSADTYTIGQMATAVTNLTSGGVRTCRVVVGTSTAEWTEADCDYLCDGTNDEVEIQAAIDEVEAAGGGHVVILNGTYNCVIKQENSRFAPPISVSGNVDIAGNSLGTLIYFSTKEGEYISGADDVRAITVDPSGGNFHLSNLTIQFSDPSSARYASVFAAVGVLNGSGPTETSFVVEGVRFIGWQSGVWTYGNRRTVISGCQFENSAGRGIEILGSGVTVNNCTFDCIKGILLYATGNVFGCTFWITEGSIGIEAKLTGTDNSAIISGNTFACKNLPSDLSETSMWGTGIYVGSSSSLVIDGNIFDFMEIAKYNSSVQSEDDKVFYATIEYYQNKRFAAYTSFICNNLFIAEGVYIDDPETQAKNLVQANNQVSQYFA